MSDQYGHYPMKTRHRSLVTALVDFTGANGASPSSTSDETGVLDATTPVTRTGEGVYRLNLRHDWAAIHPHVEVVSTTADLDANIAAIVTTAGSNSVSVVCTDADTADDLDDTLIQVTLHLSLSDDV